MNKFSKSLNILLLSSLLNVANGASNYIGYQGVAFDDSTAVASGTISLQFTIKNHSNAIVYQEYQQGISTTDKGYFSHNIGSGTRTAGAATWADLTWSDDYKLEIGIDLANGTNSFTQMGSKDFTSVAYAKGLSMDPDVHFKVLHGDIGTTTHGFNPSYTNDNSRHLLIENNSGWNGSYGQQAMFLGDTANWTSKDLFAIANRYNNGNWVKRFSVSGVGNVYPAGDIVLNGTKINVDGNSTNPGRILVNAFNQLENNSSMQDYPLHIFAKGTETGKESAGIAFSGYTTTSEVSKAPGAAITHERTDSYSKGKLHFKVRTTSSSTSDANLTTAMTISDNAKVGIGTKTPTETLDVVGNLKVSGTITGSATTLTGLTSTVTELNALNGFTGDVADLNYAKSLYDTGVTSDEFDKLDGLTADTTELNYVDGVTSNIQTQLNAKSATGHTHSYLPLSGGTLTGDLYMGAGDVIFKTGSVEYFGWTNTGNFGISKNSAEKIGVSSTEVTINEDSANVDFRVESDGYLGMLFVDGDNKVGIGTTTPSDFFDVRLGATFNSAKYAVDFKVKSQGSDNMLFVDGTNNRVGIGTSTPSTALSVKGAITIDDGNADGADLVLASTGHTTQYIDNYNGDLRFVSNGAEKMRLQQDGKLFLGRFTETGNETMAIAGGIRVYGSFQLTNESANNLFNTSSTDITYNGSGTTYNYSFRGDGDIIGSTIRAHSDKRIKTDIKPLENALETIKQIKPSSYTKIDKFTHGDRTHYGFIAQELEQIIPEAVSKGEGEVPVMKKFEEIGLEDGVEYTILVKNGEDIQQQTYTTAQTKPDGEIFVLNKKVDDFRTVDYDMVFTQAVAAIQEQQKTIEDLSMQLEEIKSLLKQNGITK